MKPLITRRILPIVQCNSANNIAVKLPKRLTALVLLRVIQVYCNLSSFYTRLPTMVIAIYILVYQAEILQFCYGTLCNSAMEHSAILLLNTLQFCY
jgi:hypothetical protein